jgi:hypothetical protein
MGPEDWAKLATDIESNYYDYDGFVVLMGTDTMVRKEIKEEMKEERKKRKESQKNRDNRVNVSHSLHFATIRHTLRAPCRLCFIILRNRSF